jgi:hypothetical protein
LGIPKLALDGKNSDIYFLGLKLQNNISYYCTTFNSFVSIYSFFKGKYFGEAVS